MGIFNFFNNDNNAGAGDADYGNDALLGLKQPLTYKECIDIYKYFPLGKRIATALPNFALSAPRVVTFGDLPPVCADEFKRLENDLQINKLVKEFAAYTRIFGASSLFIAMDGKEPHEPVHYDDIHTRTWAFNLQDPLNMTGLQISQDPLSVYFRKVIDIRINGTQVHPSRACVLFNDINFYLQWNPSTLSFASASIYQNCVKIIKSWNRCVEALERLATKSSAIIFKNRDSGAITGITAHAARKSIALIRDMQNDGIMSISREDALETFPMTGAEAVDRILEKMNQIILLAVSDTPANLLLDKELAQGFGNGEEDMKAILMAVNDFRESQISKIYSFIDKFLLYKIASPSLFEAIRDEDHTGDFKNLSNQELLNEIINSFNYEFGNLYPETEATRIDNMGRKLDNLIKLRDLGANTSDIETIINNDGALYQEEVILDNPPRFDSTQTQLRTDAQSDVNSDALF